MNKDSNTLEHFIDLDRYPIHRLDSAEGSALLESCHAEIRDHSNCTLPGFLRQSAVNELAEEITRLEKVARKVDFLATPYGWMRNRDFPADHPRSQLFPRRCGTITTEQILPEGPSLSLYQLNELTEFVRRLLKFKTLYRLACPNISVRVNIMQQGDEFGWHYDTNDGVVSFAIQNADSGGEFEFAPLIRAEDNENYPEVDGIFSGSITPEKAITPAGTFFLFMGRRSLHRVSRVEKTSQCRHSLLFGYDQNPNMVFPEHIRKRLTEPTNKPFRGID